ncbi:class I SAM-dependent methyltransferase [Candidatus Woesearchaeota archaeon]|nr:class I SAM-dependent methyltransferase [Candidatus Woesearchaeota archaeon]
MTFQQDYWEHIAEKRYYRKPQHPVTKYFVLPKIKLMKRYIKFDKNTKILDVGSGFGTYSFFFEKFMDTYSLDYSGYKLSKNPCKKKFKADANHLPFEDDSFDIVFCGALLHHVENPMNVVREMARVSKNYVVLFEPNRNNPGQFIFSLLDKTERKGLRFNKKYLAKLARKSGLRIRTIRTLGWIFQNTTPLWMAKIAAHFEYFPCAGYNLLIAQKNDL